MSRDLQGVKEEACLGGLGTPGAMGRGDAVSEGGDGRASRRARVPGPHRTWDRLRVLLSVT